MEEARDFMDSENDSNLANLQKLPYVTILFIAANVIIWLILELMGDTQDSLFMIEHGAAYQPFIFEIGRAHV